MKRLPVILIALILLLTMASPVLADAPADKGFDEFGYNYQARIFVGTGESWAMGKFGMTHSEAEAYMGVYAHDHLVMKWSKCWDDARFHGGTWSPDAWCTNEWNGMVGRDWNGDIVEGSGEVWHYKIIWVGAELQSSPYWREGGYPIWGEFEVIMSQGTVDGEHIWDAHALPTGLGGP